jgi:hypothetical protein
LYYIDIFLFFRYALFGYYIKPQCPCAAWHPPYPSISNGTLLVAQGEYLKKFRGIERLPKKGVDIL